MAIYQAMARRYRPVVFDEVIGQEHVAQTLKNAIAADRVAHAYLFCGPHGCGKTSMARIFAKALVCPEGEPGVPCNACDLCRDIMRGLDVDVQEIDGASNNGVEQVRQLREQAGYVPTRARFKIYIIDEVHMLSIAAFNALLKTLEEPPGHVKFILATTDPHKLPETVLSRTQRFDFRLVPPARLAAYLKKIVAREKAAVQDEAVAAVAAFSGGSVRDALVLLDQLLGYAQGEVTRADVERVRGVAGAEAVAGIYETVVAHEVQAALRIVDEVAQTGTNVGDFLDQLIAFGRDLMLWIATGGDEHLSAYGPAREALGRLKDAVALEHALLMLDIFAQARTRVRQRALSNPLVPLEMAVARLAGLESLQGVGAAVQKLDALARGAPLPEPKPVAPPPARTPQPEKKPEPPPPAASETTAGAPPATEEAKQTEPAWPGATGDTPAPTSAMVRAAWPRIVETLTQRRPADARYLHAVGVHAWEQGVLILSVPGGGSFLFEQIEDSHRKGRIAAAAEEALGVPVTVRIHLREGADAPAPKPRAEGDTQQDPTVRRILQAFDGQVINVERE